MASAPPKVKVKYSPSGEHEDVYVGADSCHVCDPRLTHCDAAHFTSASLAHEGQPAAVSAPVSFECFRGDGTRNKQQRQLVRRGLLPMRTNRGE